jgi:hypothetical protein
VTEQASAAIQTENLKRRTAMTASNQNLFSSQSIGSTCEGSLLRRERIRKMNRHLLMAALLLSVVALLPSMSSASTLAAGCDDNKTPVTLSDEHNWKTLCSTKVVLTGSGPFDCVATGSAMVENSVGDIHNEYRFTLATQKSPGTDLAGEQKIDVNQDPIDTDLKVQSVSAVHHFSPKAGTRTFYWLAQPADQFADNINVTKFEMGVVCTDGN